MSKGLEALKKIKNYKELTYVANITGYERVNCKLAYNDELKGSFATIEKELKDFEWLKSKVSIEWFDKLSSDDKIRFMEIMGWKYE